MKLVDANVVLRYLLDDHPQLSPQAANIIETNRVFLHTEVLCEVVYVLQGVYRVPREHIKMKCLQLLADQDVVTSDRKVAAAALQYFAEGRLDFVDCLLLACHVVNGDEVFTFDNRLRQLLKRDS